MHRLHEEKTEQKTKQNKTKSQISQIVPAKSSWTFGAQESVGEQVLVVVSKFREGCPFSSSLWAHSSAEVLRNIAHQTRCDLCRDAVPFKLQG